MQMNFKHLIIFSLAIISKKVPPGQVSSSNLEGIIAK